MSISVSPHREFSPVDDPKHQAAMAEVIRAQDPNIIPTRDQATRN